jgi:uncharacterized RDD family membrane protein YckC
MIMATSLREDYTIDTPENVTFGYEIAGIGNRFIGALIDSGIIGVLLVILNFALIALLELTGDLWDVMLGGLESTGISWLGGLLLALYALLNFAVFWGYYMLFELLWNGQTPGKRVAKTRVLRVDGNPARTSEVAVRNLVRIVDFLPAMYAFGFIAMFLNRQSRRLGDYAAGTLVIRERTAVNLDSLLAAGPPSSAISPEQAAALQARFPAVRRLSASDYDLVRQALARADRGQVDAALLERLANVVAARMGESLPAGVSPAHYLQNVAAAYESMTRES